MSPRAVPRTSEPDHPEQQLLDAFHVAKVGVHAIIADTVRPIGLGMCEFWALNYIVDHGTVNAVDIADQLAVTPPNITVAVGDLVEAGFVVRIRSSADRRMVQISATPKGRRALAGIWDTLGNKMTELTSGLPASDLAAAGRVLRALGSHSPRSVVAPAAEVPA